MASQPTTIEYPSSPVRTANQSFAGIYLNPKYRADACFKCIPQSRRLVHSPSFIASFSLSPSDPNFPPLSLLHAICAAGGRYMAKSLTSSYITGEQKDYYGHKSFVEEQATLARQSIQMNTQHGDKLLQHLQG